MVVPFYNVERYFADCLDSILAQDVANIEVLLVDDGSPDGSRAIAERYAAEDRRFRVVTRPNGGLGAARNTGVREARGRYLTFVDSDDQLSLGALRALHASLEESGSDLAVGAVERFDSGKTWYPSWIEQVHAVPRTGIRVEQFLPLLRNLYTWNKLFRRDFYDRADLWFREGVAYEDQPIITQLFARAGSIDVLPDIVYRYRARDDRSSISQQTATVKDLRQRIEAWRVSRDVIRREMSEEIYQAWLQTLFEAHFLWYLSSPGTVDDTYWEELVAAVRSYAADASPWVWEATTPAHRVLVALALQDRRADAQEFVRSGGMRAADWPSEVRDGAVVLQLPFHDDPGLDDQLFALRPEQLRLVHAVENLHWIHDDDGISCWISGWAYLEKVDLGHHRSDVAVVLRHEQSGEELVVAATDDVDLTTLPPIQDKWCDHEPGRFGARLPLAALVESAAPDTSWSVHLRVEAAGQRVEQPVTRLLRLGAAGMVPAASLSGGRRLVADWRLRRPLVLAVRRTGARLERLEVTGRRVRGELDPATEPGLVSVSATSPGGRAEARLMPGGSDGTRAFTIDLPPVAVPAVGRPLRWHVDGWTADGTAVPVAPADDALAPAAGGALSPVTSPAGRLEIEEWSLGAVADTVTVTDGALRVRGRVLGATAGVVRVVARNIRADSVTDEVPFADGRFEIAHDLHHEVHRFGRLPLGLGDHDLSVRITVDGEATTTVPIRVSTRLNDDLPLHVVTDHHEGRVVRGPDGGVRFTALRPLGDARGAYQQNRLRLSPPAGGRTRGVLLRSYFGEKATDNGIAIQAELRRRGSDLPVYWAVQDHSIPVPEGGIPVIVNSTEWFDLLGSVTYYVDNMYQPEYHRKPDHQVMVQTFHGYPFKQMGHPHWRQQQFARAKIAAYDARAAAWDYLVSPARYATPHLVRDFAYGGEVLEIGYPRNDVLSSPGADALRRTVRDSLGIRPGQTAVLYAPTFRDYLAEDDNRAVFAEFFDYAHAMERLGDDHVLLVRGHAFNARSHQRIGRIPGCIDVTDYPEVSDLYLAADLCITDYSSLRFDFAVTGKPLIFHVPDLQRYQDARGWIMDYEPTAPGPLVDTTDQVVDRILDPQGLRIEFADAYDTFRKEFLDLEDGRAAERFVDAVFVPRGDA